MSAEAAGVGAASGTVTGMSAGSVVPGIGTAIGGIAGAAAGFFGGLFGGGNSDKRMSIPPEYELQMLDQMQWGLDQTNYFIQAIGYPSYYNEQGQLVPATGLMAIYEERMALAQSQIDATMPSVEATQRLGDTTMAIAEAFGGDAKLAVESGFLDEQTARMFTMAEQEIRAGQALESGEFKNPVIENQINDQRRQLEQDLARQGIAPSQRAIAMRQFENSANELRFSASEQFKTGFAQRSSARIGGMQGAVGMYLAGRQNRFQEAVTGFNVAQGQLNFIRQGAMAGASLTESTMAGKMSAMGVQRQLAGDTMSYYQQLGQYNLSKQTKQAIESGIVGPGTMYEQTGMARREMGNYKNFIAEQERYANRYGTPISYGPESYGDYWRGRNYDNARDYDEAYSYQRYINSGRRGPQPPDPGVQIRFNRT